MWTDLTEVSVVITGASSGLGLHLAREIRSNHLGTVFNLSPEPGPDDHSPGSGQKWIPCDITGKASVLHARRLVNEAVDREELPPVSVVINNAGVNEISWLEKLTEGDWDRVMETNAKGIFLVTQAWLPELQATKGTVVNIVSNAAHMPMTGSLAYNASKGAAHIMTRQLAHELTRKDGITVFGVAPNKLAGTGMSQYIDSRVPEERGWTPKFAKEYQLRSLLCGEETDPARLAEFIGFLLSMKERHKYLSGCILPYGA